MAKKYQVTLTPEERAELEALISRGKADARKLAHARVLLQVDEAPGGPTPRSSRRWTRAPAPSSASGSGSSSRGSNPP